MEEEGKEGEYLKDGPSFIPPPSRHLSPPLVRGHERCRRGRPRRTPTHLSLTRIFQDATTTTTTSNQSSTLSSIGHGRKAIFKGSDTPDPFPDPTNLSTTTFTNTRSNIGIHLHDGPYTFPELLAASWGELVAQNVVAKLPDGDPWLRDSTGVLGVQGCLSREAVERQLHELRYTGSCVGERSDILSRGN